MIYIAERLVLETIYVLNKEILQFLGLKSAVKIKSGFKTRAGYNGTSTVYITKSVSSITTKDSARLDSLLTHEF